MNNMTSKRKRSELAGRVAFLSAHLASIHMIISKILPRNAFLSLRSHPDTPHVRLAFLSQAFTGENK